MIDSKVDSGLRDGISATSESTYPGISEGGRGKIHIPQKIP